MGHNGFSVIMTHMNVVLLISTAVVLSESGQYLNSKPAISVVRIVYFYLIIHYKPKPNTIMPWTKLLSVIKFSIRNLI